jgi:uncharacterized membrane-anchored protein
MYIYVCLCDQNTFDGLLLKLICIYTIYICSNILSPSLTVALDRLTGKIIDLCIVEVHRTYESMICMMYLHDISMMRSILLCKTFVWLTTCQVRFYSMYRFFSMYTHSKSRKWCKYSDRMITVFASFTWFWVCAHRKKPVHRNKPRLMSR